MATRTKAQAAQTDPHSVRGVIQFEPCRLPRSAGKGLPTDTRKPTYTLRDAGGKVWVYGVKDCLNFGENATPIRLNSFERYTSEDYLDLLKVMWLHLFATYRGKSETISPVGGITVPISVYNDNGHEAVKQLKGKICGTHTVVDNDGCELRIKIDPKRFTVLPESAPTVAHFLTDPRTLRPRTDVNIDVSGNTVVVDVGFSTANLSLAVNGVYQPNRAYTEVRGGFSLVANAVKSYIEDRNLGLAVDVSQVDEQLRLLANNTPGAKTIQLAGAHAVSIGDSYDAALYQLAQTIRDAVQNRFREAISLIILAGGAAYHLHGLLSTMFDQPVVVCPDAGASNVLGGYCLLRKEAAKSNAGDAIIYFIDGGNGGFKGVSTLTLA